jgi:predicted acylesterase/phospholipase RssA
MNIDTLIFSGGGFKIYYSLGALKYLIDSKFINLNNIKNFYGTSAGAIACVMLILGYNIEEIILLGNLDFNIFNEDKNIDELLNDYGIIKTQKIYFLFDKIIEKKGYDKDITLKELCDKTNKNLRINSVWINQSKHIIFDKDNYGDVPIKIILRMTISIPFVFEPVRIISKNNILSFKIPDYLSKEEYDNLINNNLDDNLLKKCNNENIIINYFVDGSIINNLLINDNDNYIAFHINSFHKEKKINDFFDFIKSTWNIYHYRNVDKYLDNPKIIEINNNNNNHLFNLNLKLNDYNYMIHHGENYSLSHLKKYYLFPFLSKLFIYLLIKETSL